MPASSFDLNIQQNSDFLAVVAVNDGQTPPNPINLTGCTLYGQIRQSHISPILASFNFFIINAENGGFQFSLPAAKTLLLPVTTYQYPLKYDIILINGSGGQSRLFMGNVNVSESITLI